MISLILAEKIFSLFLIMFMGYAVVHWGLLHAEDSKTLSLISLYLISPCVIISAFQVQYTPDVLHGLLLALAAAVLLHVGIIVVVNLLGHALHLDAVEKASMIYSNAGNLIIPIVTAVLGKEWVIYSSAFLSVQLFLLWSHAKSMLCGEKSFALKKVLTNINMIAILAGAALFLLHIQLPAVIEDSLDMVGSAIGPISMIILGMLMAGMNFKKILGYRRLWLLPRGGEEVAARSDLQDLPSRLQVRLYPGALRSRRHRQEHADREAGRGMVLRLAVLRGYERQDRGREDPGHMAQ